MWVFVVCVCIYTMVCGASVYIWKRCGVAFCMDRIYFEETKVDSEKIGERRKKNLTATTAKQSFFIMMTITIILIAYAFFCVISFIFFLLSSSFSIFVVLFSFDQREIREIWEKWDTQKRQEEKKRRFYEKSTEENEIEKHSSYGLHIHVHKQTWGVQFISPCSVIQRFVARIKYITDFCILILFLGLFTFKLTKRHNPILIGRFDLYERLYCFEPLVSLFLSVYSFSSSSSFACFLALLIFSYALREYYVQYNMCMIFVRVLCFAV